MDRKQFKSLVEGSDLDPTVMLQIVNANWKQKKSGKMVSLVRAMAKRDANKKLEYHLAQAEHYFERVKELA